jgi:hypothetical protein
VTTYDGRIMVDFVIERPMVGDDMQNATVKCTVTTRIAPPSSCYEEWTTVICGTELTHT